MHIFLSRSSSWDNYMVSFMMPESLKIPFVVFVFDYRCSHPIISFDPFRSLARLQHQYCSFSGTGQRQPAVSSRPPSVVERQGRRYGECMSDSWDFFIRSSRNVSCWKIPYWSVCAMSTTPSCSTRSTWTTSSKQEYEQEKLLIE